MFQRIAKHRANDASNDVHRPPLVYGRFLWGTARSPLTPLPTKARPTVMTMMMLKIMTMMMVKTMTMMMVNTMAMMMNDWMRCVSAWSHFRNAPLKHFCSPSHTICHFDPASIKIGTYHVSRIKYHVSRIMSGPLGYLFCKGWLAIAKLKPLSLFISLS